MRTGTLAQACLCIALACVAVFSGCYVPFGDAFKAKAERTEELTAALDGIAALHVSTNVGTITLEAADATEAHITAAITVKAKTQEEAEQLVEEVRIAAEPSGDALVIKAVKPPDFGRNQLGVDLTIVAPSHLTLECTTNVGDIRIAGFAAGIRSRTDVGSITCADLRGNVDLHTNVGDIRAVYAADAPAALDVGLSTNVGDVTFNGPADISAEVSAAANVGSIHTDRPLNVTGTIKKSVRATLGDAEGRIQLRTNVGDIRIQ
jgi:hypothetical protein